MLVSPPTSKMCGCCKIVLELLTTTPWDASELLPSLRARMSLSDLLALPLIDLNHPPFTAPADKEEDKNSRSDGQLANLSVAEVDGEEPGASDKSLTKGTCFILFIYPWLHTAVSAPVIRCYL